MSDTTNVWFLLIDHECRPIGEADELTVPLTLNVAGLKTKIKENTKTTVPANMLTLFENTDSLIDLNDDGDNDSEMMLNKLKMVFSNKRAKRLGVKRTVASLQLAAPNDILIAQLPVPDIQQKVRKRDDDDDGLPEIKRLKDELGRAPSYMAQIKHFRHVTGPGHSVDCNRPISFDGLPIELYDEAFGKFKTRCDQPPSKMALAFLNDLALVACHWHMVETSRREAVQEVFQKYTELWIDPKPTKGTGYTTDEHLDVIVIPAAIRQCKNESGDALNQVIAYYAQFLIKAMESPRCYRNLNTRFPCILMVDQGTIVGFYGAAWDGHAIRVEVLMTFDLATRHLNEKGRFAIASGLDAFKEAVDNIKAHYSKIEEDAKAKSASSTTTQDQSRKFPYMTSFQIRGQERACTYRSRLAKNVNLIFSVTDNQGSGDYIVKFTLRYSAAAHQFLASSGSAPTLWQHKKIPGDWIVVVMDKSKYSPLCDLRSDLSEEEWEKVRFKVTTELKKFHDGGFVHGDIRDTNILVSRESLATIAYNVKTHFIDFDWAGKIGEARYPTGINTETMTRPDGVGDRELITREHDESMVRYMFP